MRFRTILIDAPWPERGGGRIKRGADRHYPLMPVPKIMALPVHELADPSGCHLYSWATGNYLAAAIDCVRQWGFRLINFRPWVKAEAMSGAGEPTCYRPQNPGLGQYMRCDAELLLFAVLGKLPLTGYKPRQTIYHLRGRHSEKPLVVYDDIERMSPGPRLEMFARAKRVGWSSWGNEVASDLVIPEGSSGERRPAALPGLVYSQHAGQLSLLPQGTAGQ